MYTTNALESVNASFRKVVRRGSFPSEEAVMKLLYLRVVFVKTVVSWVARKTFRPGTASFHVRQGMPLSAFS